MGLLRLPSSSQQSAALRGKVGLGRLKSGRVLWPVHFSRSLTASRGPSLISIRWGEGRTIPDGGRIWTYQKQIGCTNGEDVGTALMTVCVQFPASVPVPRSMKPSSAPWAPSRRAGGCTGSQLTGHGMRGPASGVFHGENLEVRQAGHLVAACGKPVL
jgi:hypothetical protein